MTLSWLALYIHIIFYFCDSQFKTPGLLNSHCFLVTWRTTASILAPSPTLYLLSIAFPTVHSTKLFIAVAHLFIKLFSNGLLVHKEYCIFQVVSSGQLVQASVTTSLLGTMFQVLLPFWHWGAGLGCHASHAAMGYVLRKQCGLRTSPPYCHAQSYTLAFPLFGT